MKKILLTALLAAGMTQAQAAVSYYNYFHDDAPATSAATITFSGYCSGKITDTVNSVWAQVSNDPPNSYSGAGANLLGLNMDISSDFYAESAGSTTNIAIKNGVLNVALKDSSTYGLGEHLSRIHNGGFDSVVTCKNGQTLQVLLNDIGWGSSFVQDKSLTNKASFVLKGSAQPFDYKFAQTVSGYLDLPAVCKNTGAYTGDIATDTFQSTCKMVNKVKITLSVTASGEIYYAN